MTHETKAGIVISTSFICLVGYVVAKKSWEPPAAVTPANLGSDGKTLAAPDPTPLVNAGASENIIPKLKSPPAAGGVLQLTAGGDDTAAGKSPPAKDDKDPFAQTPLIPPTSVQPATPTPTLPVLAGDTKPGAAPDTKLATTPPLKPQDGDQANTDAMRKAMAELNKNAAAGSADNVADPLKNQNPAGASVPTLTPEPQKQASDTMPRPSDANAFATKQPTTPTATAVSTPIEAPTGAGNQAPKPDMSATPVAGGPIGVDPGARVATPPSAPPDNPGRADAGAGALPPLGTPQAGSASASTGLGTASGSGGAEAPAAPIGTERPLPPLGTPVGGSGQAALGQSPSGPNGFNPPNSSDINRPIDSVAGTNGANSLGSSPGGAPSQPAYDAGQRPVIGMTPAATVQPMQAALPGKKPRAHIESSDAKIYECRQGDTFASLAQAQYGSDKYGQALAQYNLDDPGFGAGLQPGKTLQAGQRILIPQNAYTLEGKYASLIVDRPGAPAPVQTASATVMPGNPNATATSLTGEKSYRVHTAGEMFLTIARNTLGNEDRWPEIYRLNPRFDPKDAVPGGSVLRMPGDARIDPVDMP